ncbi:MAG: Mov34/MPN/PAD-1 family protein [Acidobacteria bacterium]|nr:Mov34/MPN/PAD-1 family protein [Acidobacteriota bacterium]MCI0719163.1 Mov34/MPN/PAD-1 family protein [Acidobacteriota bacterium]
MLLGRLISEADDVVIDSVTVPGPTDRCSRFAFFRDRKRSQRDVTRAWSESAATRVYLGEWHSHPEDRPEPSGQDLKNWRRISERSKYEQNFLLFLIVGRKALRLWEFEKGRNQPVELQREMLSIQR